MSAEPDLGRDEADLDTDRQAASMQDQLSKEVAAWSQRRRQTSSETVIAPSHPVVQRRTRRPAAKSQMSSAPSPQGQPVHRRSTPFIMSYEGVTQAPYVQYLRGRGPS